MIILPKSLKYPNIINNLTPFKLVFYSYLLLELLLVIPYLAIIHYFNINNGSFNFGNKNKIAILFIVVIVGPLFETFVFQTLIIGLIKRILPKLNMIAIIISAIFFGLNHTYSMANIIYSFFVGILFAYIYILAKEKKYNPFFIVFLIHAIHNLTMRLISYIF